ncbi:hypothetical protein [Streptomyces pristinaespiralis]|uniref:hypothetical protein n=1 Tax=Streptomyces pristinaespiralis TaxID=38300 RepID=UPI0038367129
MSTSRRAREARKKRASFAGREQDPGSDEPKAIDMQPWKFTASDIPKIGAGTLDAPAILKSINEALLPVVEAKLEQVAESLGALLEVEESGNDPAAAIRAELMRRVLPQIADSVRSGVMEGIRTRQIHLAQLAAIHRQTLESQSLRIVLTRIDHELSRAGLEIVGKADDHSLFNVVEDPPGAMSRGPVAYEVAAPAYVDRESGRIVERGWLRAVPKNSFVPAAERQKPGQKRRTTHAEAVRKPKKGLNGDSEKSLPKKKSHRGQAPGTHQDPGGSPARGSGGRSRDMDGTGKSDKRPNVQPAGESDHAQVSKSVELEKSGPRAVSSRPEKGADRPAPKQGSNGGASSPAGSQNNSTGDRSQKKTSYRQSLRAAAGKQMHQRGTR